MDVASCNVAGPGFLMVRLSANYLALQVAKMILLDGPQPRSNEHGESVLVDFSSPNIAKVLLRLLAIRSCVSFHFPFVKRVLNLSSHPPHCSISARKCMLVTYAVPLLGRAFPVS